MWLRSLAKEAGKMVDYLYCSTKCPTPSCGLYLNESHLRKKKKKKDFAGIVWSSPILTSPAF